MAIDYRAILVAAELKDVGTEGGDAPGDDKYIKYYNDLVGVKFSVYATPWCAIFQTYHLRTNGIPESICPNFAGCTTLTNTFLKPKGLWKPRGTYVPKPADLILFDWNNKNDGIIDHVGMVEKVVGNIVYTIEGNTRGGYSTYGVRHKTYALTSSYIAGYGALDYESIDGSIAPVIPTTPTDTLSKYKAIVKEFQEYLNSLSKHGLAVDGSFGPATKRATTKEFQRLLNGILSVEGEKMLSVDGSFGPATRNAANMATVSYGNTGALVKLAQGALYGRLVMSSTLRDKCADPSGFDGSFGPGFKAAVSSYQSLINIPSTGTVDGKTWERLVSIYYS